MYWAQELANQNKDGELKAQFEVVAADLAAKEEEIVLDTLLNDKKPCVVALGGGAFLNKKLQKIILKETISIWLDTTIELIYKRCRKSSQRPLLYKDDNKNLKEIIKNLLKIRKSIYSKAKFRVKTNEKHSTLYFSKTSFLNSIPVPGTSGITI